MDDVLKRSRFGKFLEVSGPGGDARASALGLDEVVRQGLIEEFSGKFGVMTPLAQIEALLGVPDLIAESYAYYDLGLREDYLFAFRLASHEPVVVDFAYVRRKPMELPVSAPASPSEAEEVHGELVRLRATAAELLACVGEPMDRSGWFPYETWTYPEGLVLELRLGIVEG